jgi:ferredoxin
MPQVIAQGKSFSCESGSNLRQVLLQNGIPVYNGPAKTVNCRGLGTCGTCAVGVEGEVSDPSWREKARLSLPPHSPSRGLRLSCQTQVLGDVKVTKYDGFWGQGQEVVWPSEPTV